MKLNTRIRLPDGREGTICYHNLDGDGGIWGEHSFEMPDGGFGDLPKPEFMLRNKALEPILKKYGHSAAMECVGEEYTIIAAEEE